MGPTTAHVHTHPISPSVLHFAQMLFMAYLVLDRDLYYQI